MFFQFVQNNPCGITIHNDEIGITDVIVIESKNAQEAINKLKEIAEKGNCWGDYCSCCGDRWNKEIEDKDGEELNEKEFSCVVNEWFTRAFIHFMDGTIKYIKFVE